MQKIIIKNFGPIQEAEIELKKVLVLIGEQASGKSTIARLIYFFKTLNEDLFHHFYQSAIGEVKRLSEEKNFISDKFYDFFGSPQNLGFFNVIFHYNTKNEKYIELKHTEKKELKIEMSDSFFEEEFMLSLAEMSKFMKEQNLNAKNLKESLASKIIRRKYTEQIAQLVNNLFENNQVDSLFVIAGRNATINYSELFEKYLFAHVQSKIEENNQKSLSEKSQTIEETLMLKFIENTEDIKRFFKKYEGFDGIIQNYLTNEKTKKNLSFLKNKIEKILKGKYQIDNSGEKLVLNEKESVYLSRASSGQQEVIRILQDIFILILSDTKALRIIEEPEAHLFPVAQKHLIELLAYMVNHDEDNQLIITTHSPYMLTIFNNLLFANRVVEKNVAAESGVNEIIEKAFWLKASDFSAYSLGNSSFGEDAAYCESIFNEKTGMIQQNYLDEVSEMLGSDFQALMNIHAKTFAR